MNTKFLLISDNGDGENKTIAYCANKYEVKKIIIEWIEDGRNVDEMEVVKVSHISKVKTKIVKSTIVF
jgi:hypothetical protein